MVETRREAFARSVRKKQFWLWLSVFVPSFVLAVVVLEAIDVGTLGVFVSGALFGELSSRGVGWFTEWYILSDRADESRRAVE